MIKINNPEAGFDCWVCAVPFMTFFGQVKQEEAFFDTYAKEPA